MPRGRRAAQLARAARPRRRRYSSSARRSARCAPARARRAGPRPEVDARLVRHPPPAYGNPAAPAGRRPAAGAESQAVIVLGIDPGLANTGYGVVARRGGRLVALDGGVIETPAGLPASAGSPTSTRASRRCWTSTARRDGPRGALLRPERAHRLRRRAGPRASRCWRRASTACPAPATPRSRSRAPSAAAAARRRTQVARMVKTLLGLRGGAAARPRRRRARGRHLPRQPGAAVDRAWRVQAHDRAAARRGGGAPHRPRGRPRAAASATARPCPRRRCATCRRSARRSRCTPT